MTREKLSNHELAEIFQTIADLPEDAVEKVDLVFINDPERAVPKALE
jgi:hypothetical protein